MTFDISKLDHNWIEVERAMANITMGYYALYRCSNCNIEVIKYDDEDFNQALKYYEWAKLTCSGIIMESVMK